MYELTTEHSASSYNIPVLVDDDGNPYGPGDVLPDGALAAAWAEAYLSDDPLLDRFLAPLGPR